MVSDKVLSSLQFNIILAKIADECTLPSSKKVVKEITPSSNLLETNKLLDLTQEAYNLIYFYGFGGVEYFDDVKEELELSSRGGTLAMSQLLKVAKLLRSSRLCKSFVYSINEDNVSLFKDICNNIYFDNFIENDITTKILSDDTMSDNASGLLAQLRRKIKNLNLQIREKLQYYIRTKGDFLQDNIVTMRENRYVIPVKSEYKNKINGFIHDQSATGSTFFIEPIEVLEMNNELKSTLIEEENEINRILAELSQNVGQISNQLNYNIEILQDIDVYCAKAIYAYKTKAIRPMVNCDGNINIKNGKHPLIDPLKVVPIDIALGLKYKFLLISGPNTGGKTVTLKLVGLFTIMSMCGIFIQANEQSCISVFNEVFTDIGDNQSIQDNLSTFSSHLKNIIEIANNCSDKSLILLDEIGGGTNPDEGIALAKGIFDRLREKGSFGVITTHYTALKEYAFSSEFMKNASMEFDAQSLQPLYKVKIGSPGSSNALSIAQRLGLDEKIIENARGYLSDSAKNYEKLINNAEEEYRNAKTSLENHRLNEQKSKEILEKLELEREEFHKEREKFFAKSKAEGRRIINEKIDQADELLNQIKEILEKEEISTGDLILARTLKNKLENANYFEDDNKKTSLDEVENIKLGDIVFVKELGKNAEIIKIFEKKGKVLVNANGVTLSLNLSSLGKKRKEKQESSKITISKPNLLSSVPFKNEINLIGQTVDEALENLSLFLDKALLNNVEEVRIVHGVGLKKLSTAIHQELRKMPEVASFRFGKYGEGEGGVTIVTFK